jgi:acetylornithine/succinyldiaminopimelate/putrescine aminotransferase
MDLRKREQKYFGRHSEPELEVASAEGAYLYDPDGKEYLDFQTGWCVGNLGWGMQQMRNAISNFKGPDYAAPSFSYRPWVDLAELLSKITPGELMKSFRATGGTEAVEFALEAAILHTKRIKFISIEGCYHGNSMATFNLGTDEFSGVFPKWERIQLPLNELAADKVRHILKKEDVAAFICEPIIMNLAAYVPFQEFFDSVQESCKKYGTLFIADEIASGFGRTGKMFASEHFSLEPDIMCLAKAISGGYAPLGAVIMTTEVARSLESGPGFWSTYGWHPRSTAAALAGINYIVENQEKLFSDLDSISSYFELRLAQVKFKHGPRVRIKGAAIAVDFDQKGYSEFIFKRALEKGLILPHPEPYSLVMFPPMNIPQTLVDQGLDIIEQCI